MTCNVDKQIFINNKPDWFKGLSSGLPSSFHALLFARFHISMFGATLKITQETKFIDNFYV